MRMALLFVAIILRLTHSFIPPHTPHRYHINAVSVNDIECIPIPLQIQNTTITIVEATAQAQDRLVTDALEDSKLLQYSDPYGAVLWPAALAVSEYILQFARSETTTILELGTGTGLVALSCCLLPNVHKIIATDYEDLPLQLLEYAAQHCNPELLPTTDKLVYQKLDMCDDTQKLPKVDLVIAADVMYEPKTGRCLAKRVEEALQNGSRVIIGDSPGRAGRPAFLEALKERNIHAEFMEVPGRTVQGARNELICGPNSMSVSKDPQLLTVSILDISPPL